MYGVCYISNMIIISHQVKRVHYDTKPMGAPSKHVPLLHMLSNKDPVEVENFRQVAVVYNGNG